MTDELLISRCRLAEETGKALARGRAMLDALLGEPGAAAGEELAAAVLALCDYVDRLESTLNDQVEAVAAHRPQELDGIAAKAELLQTVASPDTPAGRLAYSVAVDLGQHMLRVEAVRREYSEGIRAAEGAASPSQALH